MKNICVFCGSSPGSGNDYMEVAGKLGRLLAEEGIGLVYGGAKVGLMGHLAETCLAADGRVVGIIPARLVKMEVAFRSITQLIVVDSMHERKAKMAEMSDGFIALPGGLGTIEEFFEVLTWAQLGFHAKPCGLLNINGYFDRMIGFLSHMVDQEFLEPEHYKMVLTGNTPEELLGKFGTYKAPKTDKAAWALKMSGDKRLRGI